MMDKFSNGRLKLDKSSLCDQSFYNGFYTVCVHIFLICSDIYQLQGMGISRQYLMQEEHSWACKP